MQNAILSLTLKAEEGEQGDVFRPLFAFGQCREDQESLPSLPASGTDTLQSGSKSIKEALGDTPSAHDPCSAKIFVGEIDEREDDADAEDPF